MKSGRCVPNVPFRVLAQRAFPCIGAQNVHVDVYKCI